jgi:GH24 family phage-related lysozyme (muramidase)
MENENEIHRIISEFFVCFTSFIFFLLINIFLERIHNGRRKKKETGKKERKKKKGNKNEVKLMNRREKEEKK